MSKSTLMGEKIISEIESGQTIEQLKQTLNIDDNEWFRFSSKANQLYLDKKKKERKKRSTVPNTQGTSEKEITNLINLNNTLANYALCMNIFTTQSEVDYANKLVVDLPVTEAQLIKLIGDVTMHPKLRVMQKKGRIEKLPHFDLFTKMIDAATISYYRNNFISCFMTLLPVVEGILIRWMGYKDSEEKPPFEDIRKFFKNSFMRQPCPYNILFHDVFCKACDKIINDHFYKPTTNGLAHSNFNRHVASHILNDNQFATKDNCIRLFILIDAMTEIYIYEARQHDFRFDLGKEDTDAEVELYVDLMFNNIDQSPENSLLF
ncbi:hypothetical protein [Flavobacterium notoginsengisoli]|uniref:hypothetical protein n=1 Tax=Flavobacterium notoginsengisoli TaxID=1478199 RepID=UPI00363439ED